MVGSGTPVPFSETKKIKKNNPNSALCHYQPKTKESLFSLWEVGGFVKNNKDQAQRLQNFFHAQLN